MINKQELKSNFTKIYNNIYKDKKLNVYDRDIINYLSTLHKNTKVIQKEIAKNLNISLDTVKKSIKKLKELGYIKVKKISMNEYLYNIIYFTDKEIKKEEKQESEQAPKEQEQESKQENNTYSFKLLEKDELKNIYDNIDVYQNKLTTQGKIDFIISLYNQKYTDYISCETIGKDGYNKIIDILNKYTLKDIVYKIKTHLENNKTIENYNGTYQFKYIITNINNIKVKNNVFWERLYFDEDFREIEKNFFI